MTEASSQPNPPGVTDAWPGLVDGASPGAVSADTAHELANLMTVVSGSLEQLRRQPLDEQGRQQLTQAKWRAPGRPAHAPGAVPSPWRGRRTSGHGPERGCGLCG